MPRAFALAGLLLFALPALPQEQPQQPPQPTAQVVPVPEDSRWTRTLERVATGVVTIQVDLARAFDTEWNTSSQATGFVVDAKRGLILTNRHVVTPGPVTAQAVFLNREEVTLYPVYRDPIHDFALAVERVRAAAEAARSLPFLLTARAENFLWGRADLADTIRRLQAFSEAGADVLYAPGVRDIATIRTVCAAVGKPVNVVMSAGDPDLTVAQLAAAGVKRISVGGALSRLALAAFLDGAREMKDRGGFTWVRKTVPTKELKQVFNRGGRP